MITAPDRPPVPGNVSERETVRLFLDSQRNTLAWKCSGLSAEQMRERAVPPSSITLIGLLRHMTEVERGWFVRGFLGQELSPQYYSTARPDDDFDDIDNQDPDEAYAIWQQACQQSREIETSAESLDSTFTRVRDGQRHLISLRWIMNHMIEEYARHLGHADLLRERIDGATGE